MTTHTVKLLDVVEPTVDLPESNLWRGQIGTVVETLANGVAFEVEFSDRSGRTYESLGLRPDQIMMLHFEPASPDIALLVLVVKWGSGGSAPTAGVSPLHPVLTQVRNAILSLKGLQHSSVTKQRSFYGTWADDRRNMNYSLRCEWRQH